MERGDLESLVSSLQRLDLRIEELQCLPAPAVEPCVPSALTPEQWRSELERLRSERDELLVALSKARENLNSTMVKIRAYYESKRQAKRTADEVEMGDATNANGEGKGDAARNARPRRMDIDEDNDE